MDIKTFLRYLVWYNPRVNGPGRVIVAYLLNVVFYRRNWSRTFPASDRHIGRWLHWRPTQGVWLYLPRRLTIHLCWLDVRVRDSKGVWWLWLRGTRTWAMEE